jgi:hypothetical protein
VLGNESNEGNHGEASVLDLLELLLLGGHVQEVESGVDLLVLGGLSASSLSSGEGNGHEEDDLGEVEGVLSSKVGGLSSLDGPLLGLDPVTISKELRGKGASGTEPERSISVCFNETDDGLHSHGPSSVDDLGLLEPGEAGGVLSEAKGIESVGSA